MDSEPRQACLSEDWPLRAKQYPLPLSPLTPLYTNVLTLRPDDWWDVQIHEGFEIGIVLKGEIIFEFKDTARMLRRGDVWLCGPWEAHRNPLTTRQPVVLVIIFLPQFLGDERFGDTSWEDLFATPVKDRPWVNTPEMRQSVLALGQELRGEIEQKPPAWESAVRLGMLRLLLVLSRGWKPPSNLVQPCTEGEDLPRILPALVLVRSNPAEHISVSDAAATCALSEAGFRMLFRRCTGMSFSDFRLHYRLSYAARRLVTSSAPLDALASEAGFADASHLHHTFVKHYGCTPGQYRALHSAREENREMETLG